VFLIPVRVVTLFSFFSLWNTNKINSLQTTLFSLQLNQNQGDKGPDSQAEMFRQMLAQHMVCIKTEYCILELMFFV